VSVDTELPGSDPYLSEPERPRGHRALLVLVATGVVLLLVSGGGALWVKRKLDPPGALGSEVEVTIRQGTTTAGIAQLLAGKGVVGDAKLFRAYLQLQGAGPFQAGRYVFHRHDRMSHVKAILEGGAKSDASRLVIAEGLTLPEVADRVGRLPGRSPQRVLDAARRGTIRSAFLPPGYTNLEGVLFPDTYSVPRDEDEEHILSRMVAAFDQVAGELGYQDAPVRAGAMPYQALIVASIVEREAKVDEDRGPIARVIYNRLQKGMKLEVDATVEYALGSHKERILNRDLRVNSPYNTYLYPGLPPGPIASPGRKALEAALEPPPGPWLYYVLSDPAGKHSFATTPAEFERAKAAAHARGLL
jgi:UPF0755 protein